MSAVNGRNTEAARVYSPSGKAEKKGSPKKGQGKNKKKTKKTKKQKAENGKQKGKRLK